MVYTNDRQYRNATQTKKKKNFQTLFFIILVFLVLDFVFYSYFSSHHQKRLDQLFHAFHRRSPARRNKLVQLIHLLLIAVITQIRAFYDFALQPLRTRSITFTTNTNLVRERRVFFHPTVPAQIKTHVYFRFEPLSGRFPRCTHVTLATGQR